MVGSGDTRGGGESIRITADCFMIISRQLSEFIGEGKHKLRPESRKTATPPPPPLPVPPPRIESVCMCVSIGPHSDSSTHTHRIVFLSMGSSEINLFNAAADAPGIPISIGIRTADSGQQRADSGQRTADCGLWLRLGLLRSRACGWQSVERGKVKSSKVNSSQVGSRNLFHLS